MKKEGDVMKKIIRRTTTLVMLICTFLVSSTVNAAENTNDFQEVSREKIEIKASSENSINVYSEPSLSECDLGIGISKNGIGVAYTTTATTIATEIGCKDIVLQEKTILGWKDIPIRDHYDYDTDIYTGSVVYLKAEVGKTYMVYCTHYAIIDEVEYTLYNITDSIVYN